MKKFLALLLVSLLFVGTIFAATDKCSKEYLQSKNHFSLSRALAENIAKRSIKKAIKKETGVNFDVSFSGYTASSIKKGVFKNMELTGKNVKIDEIEIPYINLKSLSDYNYIDYTQSPIKFKTDMDFAFDLLLSEDSINQALETQQYQQKIAKINKIASSLFVIKKVRTKIVDNKIYIIMDYNLPLVNISKDKSFVTSSEFKVVNGKIVAKNVHIDSAYGKLGLDKIANLVNLTNPLEFTLASIDENKYKGIVENVNIIDNNVKVDGKIFLKANE